MLEARVDEGQPIVILDKPFSREGLREAVSLLLLGHTTL